MSASKKPATIVTVTVTFKWVFLAVLGLTVLCLILACALIGLSFRAGRPMAKDESAMFEVCTSTFKLGFGELMGLFGGKAL